jgi:mannose-6-phosphate isomerase-like protein (cupin superfamily)
MTICVDDYVNQPVQFPKLHIIDLTALRAAATATYSNVVLNNVNDSCVRLSIFEGEYRWHYHPKSDELFVVVEGCLGIELEDGRDLLVYPWQLVTIPAMTRHRTRAIGRTMNLCFEQMAAETVFV